MVATLDRNGVISFARTMLSVGKPPYAPGYDTGTADAGYGFSYAYSRRSHDSRDDYDLAFRVARFVIYARVPTWCATHPQAENMATWWEWFKLSRDSRPGD